MAEKLDMTVSSNQEELQLIHIKPGEPYGAFAPLMPDDLIGMEGLFAIGVAAREDDAYYAAGIMTLSIDAEEKALYLNWLFVDEAFRDRGIAQMLLEKIDDHAKMIHAKYLLTDVATTPEGESLKEFLESQEFTFEVAVRPEYRLLVGNAKDSLGVDPVKVPDSIESCTDIPVGMLGDFLNEVMPEEPMEVIRVVHLHKQCSYAVVRNGRIDALLAVTTFPAGSLRMRLMRRKNVDLSRDVLPLLQSSAFQLMKHYASDQVVRVVCPKEDFRALINYLFPGVNPFYVWRGMRETVE